MGFKQKFMRNLRFEGLICGHIDLERATKICQSINESISHTPVEKDDYLYFKHLVKLAENTVYNFEETNPLPEGENP